MGGQVPMQHRQAGARQLAVSKEATLHADILIATIV
jgi:hypothetical protein